MGDTVLHKPATGITIREPSSPQSRHTSACDTFDTSLVLDKGKQKVDPEIDVNNELQPAYSETCPIGFVGGDSSAEYTLKSLVHQIPTVDGCYATFSTSMQTNPSLYDVTATSESPRIYWPSYF